MIMAFHACCMFFFFNDTATTEIYTLSLHDALPIYCWAAQVRQNNPAANIHLLILFAAGLLDRKSTRLNSSHGYISYAVFCLKKKKNNVYLKSQLCTAYLLYHSSAI